MLLKITPSSTLMQNYEKYLI